MHVFTLEHRKWAYFADFFLYGAAALALAVFLYTGPRELRPVLAGYMLAGLAASTLIEYAVHRFVLHGLPPFKTWHADHHRRPKALLSIPIAFSAPLIGLVIFLPLLWTVGLWRACAMTLG
ncbi:MAG TPA: hypothetical protein VFW49_13165, partial [Fluviicoccus sp.]|nr:hypothetical protein [Fluviicoccus sp.]